MDFREIYDNYYEPVKTFIVKMVSDSWAADDLTQDTFIKIQANLPALRDHLKIRPWIFRIARNVCLDHFRSRETKDSPLKLRSDLITAIQPVAQLQIEQHQMSRCVKDKIHMLSEPHRVALILFDTLEFSHQEIAETLGITVGNVKVRLHRARKALKEILEQDCTFEHDDRGVMVCLPKTVNARIV